MDVFDGLGLEYTRPDGSYFLLVDMSRFQIPEDYKFPDSINGRGRDFKCVSDCLLAPPMSRQLTLDSMTRRVCWFIAQEIGVVAIPPSEFYSPDHVHIGEKFARFAFVRRLFTLRLL